MDDVRHLTFLVVFSLALMLIGEYLKRYGKGGDPT